MLIGLILAVAGTAGCNSDRGLHQSWPVSAIRLRDVATEVGLTFRWPEQGPPPLDISQTIGAGCAFLDFDGDDWPDVLCVGEPVCGLFRNEGGVRFRDVTRDAGLDKLKGRWRGIAVGDYDADGRLDLLLTGYDRVALLRQVSKGKFAETTKASGINCPGWSSSAGFADLDNDGDLDLVIGRYVKFGNADERLCRLGSGVLSGCPPAKYQAYQSQLYRNDRGRFTDVSGPSGFLQCQGKTLALGFCDYDDDGDLDIYLANDGTPADLFTNLGRFKFRNDNFITGTAHGSDNVSFMAGMGVDWGDYDNDGDFDLAVTNFSNVDYSLFQNRPPVFKHVSAETGISEVTRKPLGFGERFVDLDGDGWLDLVFANGHVYDNVKDVDPTLSYRQPLIVMKNVNGASFREVTAEAGSDAQKELVGRGLAAGDYDRDGRPDLLVVDYAGQVVLLHNESTAQGSWLGLRLAEPGTGRNGGGAWAEVKTPTRTYRRGVTTTSSYLSSSEPSLLFGLGEGDRVESVTVHWLSGQVTRVENPKLSHYLNVIPTGVEAGG